MGRHLFVGLAVMATTAGAVLVAGAGTAAADTPTPLFVNNTAGSGCSDAGAGTQAQPFCTIAAALGAAAAGRTLDVDGIYTERVTVTKPVTLQRHAGGVARLSGAAAGFTIDGQHDVTITGFYVQNVTGGTAVDVRNSARITIQDVQVVAGPRPAAATRRP